MQSICLLLDLKMLITYISHTASNEKLRIITSEEQIQIKKEDQCRVYDSSLETLSIASVL
jgi:hypothetical protein